MKKPILTALPILMILGLLSLFGCGEHRSIPAVGPYSDVWFFSEQGLHSDPIRNFVETLSRPIHYAFDEENEFDVYVRDYKQFPGNRDRKNIILYTRIDHRGGMLTQMQRMLGKDILARVRRERQLVLYREDLFARDQDVYFLLAADADAEETILGRMGASIRQRMRDLTRDRYRDYLLHNRENRGGTKYLQRRYGFSLRYPGEYHLLQDRPDLGAVELHRKEPSRVMGVFWTKEFTQSPALSDSTELMAWRHTIVDSLYHGDYVLDSDNVFTESEIAGRSAVRVQGIWQNERDMTGGPFVTYFVRDEARDRLIALDLLIYAPGQAKHPYMRELEALASTLRF